MTDWLERLDKLERDAEEAESLSVSLQCVSLEQSQLLRATSYHIRELIDGLKERDYLSGMCQEATTTILECDKDADNLRALLRREEWGDYGYCDRHSRRNRHVSHDSCPTCGNCKEHGHTDNCERDKLLNQARR